MAFVAWNDSLSVSIAAIDDQHKKLIDIMNELHDAMKTGKGKDALTSVLEKMAGYTVEHFSFEENMLNENGYPGFNGHKFQHDEFVRKVNEFKKDFASGKALVSIDVLNFLRDWLIAHIADSDQQYASFMSRQK
ncbi:MAG: hemerythrin [Spirochaetes bacterium GWF1_51_8]|nr:MAG: hemerythrin [Spirochaetes bacterium GWF1_51_8]